MKNFPCCQKVDAVKDAKHASQELEIKISDQMVGTNEYRKIKVSVIKFAAKYKSYIWASR